jgi:uncharacterized damage-inducible protein DinB
MGESAESKRPQTDEYAEPYAGYVGAVPDGPILVRLEEEGARSLALYGAIDDAGSRHRYALGKWTVRQVLAHVTDSERVFAYRALRIARGDRTPLAGFDQELWMNGLDVERRPLPDMVEEWRHVRAATLLLFRGFVPEAWERRGVASGYEVSVRALAWIAAGHELHHRRILAERYGLRPPA